MKKNGFVFVETIVAIVILTSSLLLLYTTFSKILQTEKRRVYYDNMSYIYRTWYIKNKLNKLNISAPLDYLTSDADRYFVTVGTEYQGLFSGKNSFERDYVNEMFNDFEVNQIIIVKENKIDNLKKCKSNDTNNENCINFYNNLSEEMISYFKTMYVDVTCNYVMVVEYKNHNCSDNCKNYYSWVSV